MTYLVFPNQRTWTGPPGVEVFRMSDDEIEVPATEPDPEYVDTTPDVEPEGEPAIQPWVRPDDAEPDAGNPPTDSVTEG